MALRALQGWVQAVISHPGGPVAGAASAGALAHMAVAPGALDAVVEPSAHLTAEQRLGLYSRGYTLRLLECLRSMHPALRHALGDAVFEAFALDYLAASPSRSYALQRLNAGFAGHLEASRPEVSGGEEPWPDFVVDLARLERSFMEVFDGPGTEGAGGTRPELPQLPHDSRRIAFVANPSLRLHSSRYPVGRYLSDVREGRMPSLPQPGQSYLALVRREFRVRQIALTEPEYRALDLLAAGGSLRSAAAAAGQDAGTVWGWAARWWTRDLLVGVRTADGSRAVEGRSGGSWQPQSRPGRSMRGRGSRPSRT
ncbi:MAG: DNA-binding domain-containing protein [Actinomycetota bacterium]